MRIAIVVVALSALGCQGAVRTTGEPDTSTDPGADEVVSDGACTTAEDCDDSDPCTEDECDSGDCSHTAWEPDVDGDGYVDAACGGDDCDDAHASAHPGADEVCNDGIDNDCDGHVDGPAVLPSDVQLTETDSAVLDHAMSIVWAGDQFGLAWVDDRDGNNEIYLGRVSPAAEELGAETRETDAAGDSFDPSIAWSGSEFGLAWYDTRDGSEEIYFARIDGASAKIGADVRVTNASGVSAHPSLVWSGSEYGLAWDDQRDGNAEIYFVRMSAGGAASGAEVRVTDATGVSSRPSLQWTGSRYCMAWGDERETTGRIYFVCLDPSGVPVGAEAPVTGATGSAADPSLAWTGTGFGVAWADYRSINNDIYFALLGPDGAMVGTEVRITTDDQTDVEPFIAWKGDEFGIVWTNWGGYSDCYYGRISASGVLEEADLAVPDGTASSSYNPTLAWSGEEFGMGLMEYRDFVFNVFFNRIGFCE